MDESVLFNGVLRSVLGGRRKSGRRALRYLTGGSGSFWTNPSTLLTAAGVAWGIYETLQSGATTPAGAVGGAGAGLGSAAAAPHTPSTTAPMPPLPNVGGVSPNAMRLLRLTISAASADGVISDGERSAIVEQARKIGVGDLVEAELNAPRPLREIVAGVTDSNERATLYVLAFTVLRGDEQPTGAERIYLAQLANLLGMDPAETERLERNVGASIDKQQ